MPGRELAAHGHDRLLEADLAVESGRELVPAPAQSLRYRTDVGRALRTQGALPLAILALLEEEGDVALADRPERVDHVVGVVPRDSALAHVVLRQVRDDEIGILLEPSALGGPADDLQVRER